MTLAAAASYIAVPAALKVALPEAFPALGLTLALCLTFPFNLLIGIPLSLALAQAVSSRARRSPGVQDQPASGIMAPCQTAEIQRRCARAG